MNLDEARTLAVDTRLQHIWTGDQAAFVGLADDPHVPGLLLVRFDHATSGAATTIDPSVMHDLARPFKPILTTYETGGYASCSRCQGVYDTGPGDRADACPDCGPVWWPLLAEHTQAEWEAAALPRADCSVCGRNVATRLDDTVRTHRPPPDRPGLATPGGNCLGSYR